MTTHVALLRAVNVGGRSLPMASLRAIAEGAGYTEVRTYLQSGNLLVRAAGRAGDAAVAAALEKAIRSETGLDVPVIVRRPAELRDVLGRHPFAAEAAKPSDLHVAFLAAKPARAAAARLDPERSPGDRFAVDGREVFIHYAHGAGHSKLTLDWLERGLGVRATARNWNTVGALADLAEA